ncbi:MAG: hypothetical protein RMJ07_05040 [Nitrososphaerota archaeon]|nr:hypothetical protein [Candidatus Bathyarchaeota archaeon]MDW8049031.1 hypothetical protein [Nitrososphaerota archaeon]
MSRTLKRRLSSFSYGLKKTYSRISAYKPSPLLIATIVMIASIFLIGGGVFDLFMSPITYIPSGGRIISFLPWRIHEQLLMESLGVMLLYATGSAGLLMVYYSIRYSRNPQQASLLLKIGVILLLVAFVMIEIILFWKINYPSS